MNSLPNEGRKYELVDHTVWYGISDLSCSNYVDNYRDITSLLASLNFTGTVNEFLEEYVILINSKPLTGVESPHNFRITSSLGTNTVDSICKLPIYRIFLFKKKLTIDSHNYMRLLRQADKNFIEATSFGGYLE